MGNLKLQIWEIYRITDQHPLWPPWERPVWAHWRPHWCPWTGSGGLNLCWSNPFPPAQSAPRQSGSSSSSDAAYILQSSLYSKQSPWLPWAFAGSTRSKRYVEALLEAQSFGRGNGKTFQTTGSSPLPWRWLAGISPLTESWKCTTLWKRHYLRWANVLCVYFSCNKVSSTSCWTPLCRNPHIPEIKNAEFSQIQSRKHKGTRVFVFTNAKQETA